MGVRPSMGTVGDAYDNAMAESFFASLECELIDRRSFKTKTEARLALFTWIEGWYNPRRRHSALGQVSPVELRKEPQQHVMQPPRLEHGLTHRRRLRGRRHAAGGQPCTRYFQRTEESARNRPRKGATPRRERARACKCSANRIPFTTSWSHMEARLAVTGRCRRSKP